MIWKEFAEYFRRTFHLAGDFLSRRMLLWRENTTRSIKGYRIPFLCANPPQTLFLGDPFNQIDAFLVLYMHSSHVAEREQCTTGDEKDRFLLRDEDLDFEICFNLLEKNSMWNFWGSGESG